MSKYTNYPVSSFSASGEFSFSISFLNRLIFLTIKSFLVSSRWLGKWLISLMNLVRVIFEKSLTNFHLTEFHNLDQKFTLLTMDWPKKYSSHLLKHHLVDWKSYLLLSSLHFYHPRRSKFYNRTLLSKSLFHFNLLESIFASFIS